MGRACKGADRPAISFRPEAQAEPRSEQSSSGTVTRLSICIPTYNFGAFIGDTLESVLPQVVEGIEVVILDGGSSDNTTEIVESFQPRFPSLRYHRRDQ